nr:cytochrome P450 3A41-like [Biomphalaria glabrata]
MDTLTQESGGCCGGATFYLTAVCLGLVVYLVYKQGGENWEKYGVKHINRSRYMFDDLGKAMGRLLVEEGDTVGLSFAGLQLLTRDIDLLRNVLVKDFNNYVDRTVFIASNSPVEKGVFFLGGHDWRRIRHVISPSFSSGKIKFVCRYIDESAIKLGNLLETYARDDQLVPMKHVMSQFTSEIIARTALSLRTDCLGKKDDEFLTYSQKIFKIHSKLMNFIMLSMMMFPWLHKFVVKKLKVTLFDSVDENADKYFQTVLNSIVEERKLLTSQGKQHYTDLLQNLLLAQQAGENQISDGKSTESWDNLPKTMSHEELMGQVMLIIFAGFDTTASTLQMCFYRLAKNPEIDRKVFEEIEKVVSSDIPTYEEIQQLKYMEQVLNETLRLHPPAPIVSRRAAETRTYGSITIPKGAGVTIPVDMIMRDPKHYPDPEKFDPDRFTEENVAQRDPMTFIPFGYGPRQCIGMRLAYIELKYCLVHVLRKVKFELNERTEPKPDGEIKTSFQGIIVLDKPIQLAVKARKL